jgi:hypothetical protein
VQAKNGYALEPDPYAFDEVRANLALNPRLQDHTSIFWKCIMDKPGIYPMGGGGGDSMASVGSANHPKSWKVRFHTIHTWSRALALTGCDVLFLSLRLTA